MKAAGAAPPDGRAGEEAPMWLGRMGMSRLAVRVPEACGALLCGGAAGDPSRCHSPATFPLGPGDGNGEEARTDLDAAPVEKPSPLLPLKSSPDGAGRNGEASTVAYSDRDSAVESSSLDEGGPAAAAPGIGASGPVSPLDWGYPGHLTEAEAEALEGLRAVICPPPGGSVPARSDLREAVFSFGEQEDEDHALCRWLRARRFVLADVLAMIEGAAEERRGPASRDFYPDAAADALGVDEGIYRTQYPQCYPGTFSRPCPQLRSPCPLIFNQPGRLNWSGVRCVAQLSGVHRYQWHCYQHALGDVLRERSRTHPATFIRYQVVAVLDLDGLSRSAVNACVLDLVREQSRVESLCYPEMLGICLVLNAPTFFGAVWAMVRRWIDQRTAAKMEIYCRRAAGHRRLRELVDDADLPSDYGGSGPSVAEIILRTSSRLEGGGEGRPLPARRLTKLWNGPTHKPYRVELVGGEALDVRVYTRSVGGARFHVEDGDGGAASGPPVVARCPEDQTGEDDPPYHAVVARCVRGPATVQVRPEAVKGSSGSGHFLLVCDVMRGEVNG